MSRTAYIFIFLIIGLSLTLHALDERSDREVIGQAASIALYDGVKTACNKRNLIRDSVSVTAASLHPSTFNRAEIRRGLNYEDCDDLARKSTNRFQKQLRDKEATKKLLEALTDPD